ncbi:DUF5065 domain-containing protein, partial [Bacillus anthracis]
MLSSSSSLYINLIMIGDLESSM